MRFAVKVSDASFLEFQSNRQATSWRDNVVLLWRLTGEETNKRQVIQEFKISQLFALQSSLPFWGLLVSVKYKMSLLATK